MKSNNPPGVDCSKYKPEELNAPYTREQQADLEVLEQHTPSHLDQNLKSAEEQLQKYPQTSQLIADWPKKYGAAMCADRNRDGRAGRTERAYTEGKADYDKFLASVKAFADTAPAELPNRLEKATGTFETHAAKNEIRDATHHRLLDDDESDVSWALRSAKLQVDAVKVTKGPTSAEAKDAQARYDAELVELRTRLANVAEAALAAVEAPKAKYQGADTASLVAAVKKAWKESYPKDEVLAVVFTGDGWHRSQNTQRWEATWSWRHYDNDWLNIAVVTRRDAKVAEAWYGQLRKDHEDHDTLKFDDASKAGTTAEPFLASKISKVK